VQVAPALAPHLRLVRPAQVRAGQKQLEALGERRLAAAVAPDDQRQPRPRCDLQPRRRADAAEVLDRDLLEVDPRRLGDPCGGARALAARGHGVAIQMGIERGSPVGRREDRVYADRRDLRIALEAVDELLQRRIVHRCPPRTSLM
jgi:hypothetical protein